MSKTNSPNLKDIQIDWEHLYDAPEQYEEYDPSIPTPNLTAEHLHKHFGTTIEKVCVSVIDLDAECQMDLLCGRGIRLTSVEAFDTKKKNEKIWEGLQSEFFGSDFSEEYAFQERWSCKCKKYIGKAYQGWHCEKCDSDVEYHDIDLTKTGWIITNNFEVINPIIAAKLSNALGKFEQDSVFDKMITMKYHEEGEECELSDKELIMQKKHPFIKKGMLWLREHLPEVLDYYDKRKPTKHKVFEQIRRELEAGRVWTHCIPAYSALMRTELPAEKDHKLYKLPINTNYQTIIRLSNSINSVRVEDYDAHRLNSIDIKLAGIQRKTLKIFDLTVAETTGKPGIIVSKILGGRYNFSSRCIIIPSSGKLRSDQIEMGYLPFLELFRYEIINFYKKLSGCTYIEASNAWKKATNHFDPIIYSIMEHMVTDPKCRKYCTVLLGRNPYINYGSVLFMTIVHVKKDITDKTMTIPSHIIVGMNADFDGDILGAFRIIGEDMGKRFGKNLNPRYNLFISRMDGHVNKDVLPVKDENVAFWGFNVL